MRFLFFIMFALLSSLLSGCNETEDGYQGYVEVDYIHLAPQVSGRVVSLPVVRGQQVHAGDVVLQLDDTKEKLEIEALQAQLAGAQSVLDDLQTGARVEERKVIEAQLAEAEATRDHAAAEFKRYQKLYAERSVTASSFEAKTMRYKTAQARVESITHRLTLAKEGSRTGRINAQKATLAQLRARIKKAEYLRSLTTIRAPEDAQVFDRYYHQGELVPAGHVALSLIAPNRIKVRFFVPQAIARTLKVGERVTFTGIPTSEGTITWISPTSEYTPPVIFSNASNKRLVFMVEARPDLSEAQQLVIGQPVKVTLHAAH